MMEVKKEEVKRLLAGRWDILFYPYLRTEKQRKNKNGQLICLCPFHDDKTPSLSINTQNGVFRCFGCEAKGDGFDFLQKVKDCNFHEALQEAAAKVGLDGPVPPNKTNKITVAQLAKDKNIPEKFLRSRMGLKEKDGGVLIPYLDMQGNPTLRQRKRTCVSGNKGSTWYKGKKPIGPYGIWALPKLREMGKMNLILVEGESDVWTLWFNKFPAIGLPGANMAAKLEIEQIKGFEKVFVWQEPDKGGKIFVQGIRDRLKKIGFVGEIIVIKTDEAKDPNNLFKNDPEKFKEKMKSLMKTSSSEGRQAKIVSLADVDPQEVYWLWEPYIPIGKLTLLEGDPGMGKTYIALQLAASLSQGNPLPTVSGIPGEKRTPVKVLYMSAEDGLADTLRPRLDSLEANVKNVYVLTGWQEDEKSGQVSLADLGIIAQAIKKTRPELLVIDPLQGYLGAETDMHRANEVRPLLSGLGTIAEEHKTAVLLIRHLSKSNQVRALYRGLGSIDFTAAARSVLLVGNNPDNPRQRAMIHLKSSLAKKGPALGFEIDENRFFWTGLSDMDEDLVLGAKSDPEEKTALEEAIDFLKEFLSEGPQPPSEVTRKAKTNGISERTLRRAKEKLGIKAEKVDRFTWNWFLPHQFDHMDKLDKLNKSLSEETLNQPDQLGQAKNGQVEKFEEGEI